MRRTAPTHAIYLLTILTAATLLALATAGLAFPGGAVAAPEAAPAGAGPEVWKRYDVTIELANGSYAGATVPRALPGGGTLFIKGNETTPASRMTGISSRVWSFQSEMAIWNA